MVVDCSTELVRQLHQRLTGSWQEASRAAHIRHYAQTVASDSEPMFELRWLQFTATGHYAKRPQEDRTFGAVDVSV